MQLTIRRPVGLIRDEVGARQEIQGRTELAVVDDQLATGRAGHDLERIVGGDLLKVALLRVDAARTNPHVVLGFPGAADICAVGEGGVSRVDGHDCPAVGERHFHHLPDVTFQDSSAA